MTNIACSFDQVAAENIEKIVLISRHRSLTWKELDLKAGGVASYILSRGISSGARLAICVEDPIDTVIGILGGLKAGCVITPFNSRLIEEERCQIMSLLNPSLVLKSIPEANVEFSAIDVESEEPAIILFTSGSTGLPKGVVLSHRSVKKGLDMWSQSALAIKSNDIVLSVLPLAHSYGLFGTVLSPLRQGASSVLVPRFDVEEVLRAISDNRATIFCGVATMFRRILESKSFNPEMLACLRFSTSGAAPCPWELAVSWKKNTGLRIVRGYGMSELFRPICYSPDDEFELPNAIGRAAIGVKLKIVGDDGHAVKGSEPGELWIKTDSCMTEYLENPDDTNSVMKDGWFMTGDLATISSEGLVSVVGRKKEVILRGGYTVAAGEVEFVLNTYSKIAESAVTPIPDPDLGEEICAFVVLRSGSKCTEQEIIDYCKTQMAAYKYPRVIKILSELPKGETGKVQKAKLGF